MRSIAIFVDTGNLYYCIGKKFPGRKLDYSRFIDNILGSDSLYKANAYGTQIKDEALGFITCLKKVGYNPVFKSIGETNHRITHDCAITLDALDAQPHVDTIVIASAKPDLVPLVQHLRSKGTRVVVFACGVNKELKATADSWLEIDEDLLELKV